MDSLLVVVLCVCLAGQVLGLPQPLDSDTTIPTRWISAEQSSGKDQVITELQESQLMKRSPAEDGGDFTKHILHEVSPLKKEEVKEPVEGKSQLVDSSKSQVNIPLPDGQAMADEEDSVRKKKSASMQDGPHIHNPQTTTVCIQLRSDHPPRVVCGDPLNDSKKEGDQSVTSPTKARVAFRSPNDYFPHTYEQHMPYMPAYNQPNIYRASPQNMMPEKMSGRSSPANQIPLVPTKSPVMNQGSMPMSPKAAARGLLPGSMFPLKRSEEQPSPKIGDATIPQGPPRLPGLPQNTPIVVHKQYFQPASPYHLSNMVPGPPSPLRLNCATEGGFIPYLRSGQPDGYIPMEERLIVNPMATRMAETPEYMDNQQAYFIDPEVRQDISDNIVGSPYLPDGLSGTLFVDEEGQAYMVQGTQGRSAMSDQFLGEMKEDLEEKTRRQEKELQRSNEELEDLKKQLKTIQMKVAGDVEKKENKKDMTEMKKDTSELIKDSPEKKLDPSKNAKRNVFRITDS